MTLRELNCVLNSNHPALVSDYSASMYTFAAASSDDEYRF